MDGKPMIRIGLDLMQVAPQTLAKELRRIHDT
jgi:hypothetical protein